MPDRFESLRRALSSYDAEPEHGNAAHFLFGYECEPETIRALLDERDDLARRVADLKGEQA